MAAQWDGKVAVVTRGASGIGRAHSPSHARVRAVVADVLDDGGEETVHLIKEAGGEGCFVHTDVADPAAAQRLIRTTTQAASAALDRRR